MTEIHDELRPLPALTSETVFVGHVWDVVRESFEIGGQVVSREFVNHPGSVGVFALDNDDQVRLIQQYRHPLRVREWEIPAGLVDQPGEGLLETAKRELAEEADLTAAEWHLLGDFSGSPGMSNELIRIYLARQLAPISARFDREHEEAELENAWVPLDQVVDAVLAGSVRESPLSLAALLTATFRDRGWRGLRPATAKVLGPGPHEPPTFLRGDGE